MVCNRAAYSSISRAFFLFLHTHTSDDTSDVGDDNLCIITNESSNSKLIKLGLSFFMFTKGVIRNIRGRNVDSLICVVEVKNALKLASTEISSAKEPLTTGSEPSSNTKRAARMPGVCKA